MSGREWKPASGDVAEVLNGHGVWNRAICAVTPDGFVWKYGVADSTAPISAPARRLLVIDPEDKAAAHRLACLIADREGMSIGYGRVQDGLREFLRPPKPEVYEHLAVVNGDGATSICGKVWTPSDDVTVVGKCPECVNSFIGTGWIA